MVVKGYPMMYSMKKKIFLFPNNHKSKGQLNISGSKKGNSFRSIYIDIYIFIISIIIITIIIIIYISPLIRYTGWLFYSNHLEKYAS